MTYSELKTGVASRIGRTDMDTSIARYINDAQMRLAREPHRWASLDVWDKTTTMTTASQEYVTPPTDVLNYYTILVADGTSTNELRMIVSAEFDRLYPNPAAGSTGKPVDCCVKQGVLYLSPVPDAVYVLALHYKKRPTDLVGDTDTLTMTDADNAVIAIATAMCAEEKMLLDQAQYWWQRAAEETQRLILNEENIPALNLDGFGRGFGLCGVAPSNLNYTSPFYRGI